MKPAIRIAVLHFSHETVTFLANDTTLEDFTYPGSPASGEALLTCDPRGYMGGFVKMAREFEAVELIGIESPLWPRTGTGSGWITTEAFETFVGRMIAELHAQGPFDGAYLCLHGAAAVRGIHRPEAEIARRVRAVIGEAAFIAGTFDPHGNEDAEFLRHANMAFAVKYFPHYDGYLQGERAARCLVRAIRGNYVPTHVTQKVPILSPTVFQWTGASPWMNLVQQALTWEAREPDLFVNFFFGFPWSDVPDVGMTFQVLTNNNPDLARKVADDMAASAWRQRAALLTTARIHTISDGVAAARKAVAEGQGPVVLADHSDRSGYATWLLQAIIDQGLSRTLIGTVADGPLVSRWQAEGAKLGDAVDVLVGGGVDDSAGPPVRVQGTILAMTPVSQRVKGSTWFHIGFGDGNVLLVSPYLAQVIEPATFTSLGLSLGDFDVFVIKSRVHFRRGFDDSGFARTILLVEPDQPFLGTVRLDGLPYRNVDLTAFYPYGDVAFAPS